MAQCCITGVCRKSATAPRSNRVAYGLIQVAQRSILLVLLYSVRGSIPNSAGTMVGYCFIVLFHDLFPQLE